MRILQVIDQLNVGGAERVLVDLSNILHQRGEKVTVLTLVSPGKLAAKLNPGIPFINLGRRNRFSLRKLFRVHQICCQFDVAHIHLRYNFRYVALAKLLFGGKFRLLLHDHFGDIENDKSVPLGLSFCLRCNPWFAGVSRPLEDWAIQCIGLRRENVFLLPNIIIRKKRDYRKVPRTSILKIVLVSNFREAKNHAFACRLLARLNGVLKFSATFIGHVIDERFMNGLRAQITANELDGMVTIIHDCTDVQEVIGDFDLAIHTAYQESGPLVLIEYLAQQVPFLAYKTGEVSAQIQSVIPEFFLDSFDIEQWIDRVKTLLKHPGQYDSSMNEAFNSLFSEELYFEKCMGIYSQMMANE